MKTIISLLVVLMLTCSFVSAYEIHGKHRAQWTIPGNEGKPIEWGSLRNYIWLDVGKFTLLGEFDIIGTLNWKSQVQEATESRWFPKYLRTSWAIEPQYKVTEGTKIFIRMEQENDRHDSSKGDGWTPFADYRATFGVEFEW